MRFETVQKDHITQLAVAEDFAVAVWHGQTTVEAVRRMSAAFDKVVEGCSTPLGMITVIAERAPVPGSDVRHALAELMEHIAPNICASAMVIEGDSFRDATVRAVMSAIQMIRPAPYPLRIYSRVDEAMAWLVDLYLNPLLGTSYVPQTLVRKLGQLRREPGAPSSYP